MSNVNDQLASFQAALDAVCSKSEISTDFPADYYLKHKRRFVRTAQYIPEGTLDDVAFEVGATHLFQVSLKEIFNYGNVSGTVISQNISEKKIRREYSVGKRKSQNISFSLDVESELLPFQDESVDFIMCCEVIEHLDIDPMFMLSEFNRVTRNGGQVLITTPNCCSARNFWKMTKGYRPHFFTQYQIDRSPYRHNFEYDVHALTRIVNASGFEIERIDTVDVFEEPVPKAISALQQNGWTTKNRGDGIFLLARKTSAVIDRYPSDLYV